MAKFLSCKDAGYDWCPFSITAETEEELLRLTGEHASAVHSLVLTPEMVSGIRKAIKNV